MNFTESEIAAIVGIKELELIALRTKVAQLTAELEALKMPTPDPKPKE